MGDVAWRTTPWTGDGRPWSSSEQSWAEIALVRLAQGASPTEAFAQLDHESTMHWISKVFSAGLSPVAFTYMTRRFGPPSGGYDDYKELGAWCLTTPSPDVMIRIAPKGSSVSVGVGSPGVPDHHRPSKAVRSAVRATLTDLFRPVCIRDEYISVAGICPPPAREGDEAAYFEWTGYGVKVGYWDRFKDEGRETKDAAHHTAADSPTGHEALATGAATQAHEALALSGFEGDLLTQVGAVLGRLDAATAQAKLAEAGAAALREALEALACDCDLEDEPDADPTRVAVDAALASDAGRAFLKRLDEAEARDEHNRAEIERVIGPTLARMKEDGIERLPDATEEIIRRWLAEKARAELAEAALAELRGPNAATVLDVLRAENAALSVNVTRLESRRAVLCQRCKGGDYWGFKDNGPDLKLMRCPDCDGVGAVLVDP